MKNIEFDNINQHIRCLAHIINLAVQAALKSLNAIANVDENEFLTENVNNIQRNENVSGILYKVNIKYFFRKISVCP